MKMVKFFLVFLTALTLCFSTEAIAKKAKKGSGKQKTSSESSLANTNRQSKTGENVRGKDRAAERHDLNPSKAPEDFGSKGSDSSQINSNRQLKTEENVRGQDRASERHDLNQPGAPDNPGDKGNQNREARGQGKKPE